MEEKNDRPSFSAGNAEIPSRPSGREKLLFGNATITTSVGLYGSFYLRAVLVINNAGPFERTTCSDRDLRVFHTEDMRRRQ
jgi:hypothetical protein